MCGKDREGQVHGHGECFVAIAAAMAVAMAAAIVAMVACLRQRKATYCDSCNKMNGGRNGCSDMLQSCKCVVYGWRRPEHC